MFKVNWTAGTCGYGYWSDKQKQVRLTAINVPYINREGTFGELRVYFDVASWSVPKDGLIYTDSQFLDQLRDHLFLAGYDTSDVDYSEQGMQGDDYVSLDIGKNFLRSWIRGLA